MNGNDIWDVLEEVSAELRRAIVKFPKWQDDKVHQAAIVAEECGELVRDALQYAYEGGTLQQIRTEAIQTAAMAVRLLINLPEDEKAKEA